MAWAQLGVAAASGIANLIGGQQGNSAARKAATQAFAFNIEAQQQAFDDQLILSQEQNRAVDRVNDRIRLHNVEETTRYASEVAAGGYAIDFDRLVKDSEASGFNPLTVLRAGGMAGYSRTPTPAAFMSFIGPSGIPQASQPAAHAAAPQNMNVMGDAFNAALGAYNSFDPFKAQRQQLEMGIAQAQLRNLDSDTAKNNRSLAVPTWTDTGRRLSSGGIGGAMEAVLQSNGLGSAGNFEANPAGVTNPYKDLPVDASRSDAEAHAARSGDMIGEYEGFKNYLYDAIKQHNSGAKLPLGHPLRGVANVWNNGLAAATDNSIKAILDKLAHTVIGNSPTTPERRRYGGN